MAGECTSGVALKPRVGMMQVKGRSSRKWQQPSEGAARGGGGGRLRIAGLDRSLQGGGAAGMWGQEEGDSDEGEDDEVMEEEEDEEEEGGDTIVEESGMSDHVAQSYVSAVSASGGRGSIDISGREFQSTGGGQEEIEEGLEEYSDDSFESDVAEDIGNTSVSQDQPLQMMTSTSTPRLAMTIEAEKKASTAASLPPPHPAPLPGSTPAPTMAPSSPPRPKPLTTDEQSSMVSSLMSSMQAR